MELLEGEALAERLRRGPLSVSETVPIGLGMLAALSALHARGIVHRDLKPSNVFLTPHGVKLLDFGLARPELEQSLSTATELTRTGIVMGTPRYMAPEQVTGEAVDARSDLFAAGAILFEMLAGRPAFGGRTIVEILHATLHEQPPALTGSPAVAAVDRVIRRALAKRPAERPASADAMAEELCAVRDAAGVLADAQGDFSTACGLGVPQRLPPRSTTPGSSRCARVTVRRPRIPSAARKSVRSSSAPSIALQRAKGGCCRCPANRAPVRRRWSKSFSPA